MYQNVSFTPTYVITTGYYRIVRVTVKSDGKLGMDARLIEILQEISVPVFFKVKVLKDYT